MHEILNLLATFAPFAAGWFALSFAAKKQEKDFSLMARSVGTANKGDDFNRCFTLGNREFSADFKRSPSDDLIQSPAVVRLSTRLPLDVPFVVRGQSGTNEPGFADGDDFDAFDRDAAGRLLDDPLLKSRLKNLFDLGARSVALSRRRLEVRWVGGFFRAPVGAAEFQGAVAEFAALAANLQTRQAPPPGPPDQESSIGDGYAAERRMGSIFGAGLGIFAGLALAYGQTSLPADPAERFRFATRSLVFSVPLIAAAYIGLQRAYLRRSPLPQVLVIPVWLAIGAVITAACLAAEAAIRH